MCVCVCVCVCVVSGFIDFNEFKNVVRYLGINKKEKKLKKMFASVDADGSGQIDFDEFKQLWSLISNVKNEMKAR